MIVWKVEELDLTEVDEASPRIEMLPLRVEIVADVERKLLEITSPTKDIEVVATPNDIEEELTIKKLAVRALF